MKGKRQYNFSKDAIFRMEFLFNFRGNDTDLRKGFFFKKVVGDALMKS